MFDKDAPTSRRALAELEKPNIPKLLVRIARLSTRADADAEDLVADALVHVLDPDDAPWTKGTFLNHMMYLMRHLWADQLRLSRVQHEVVDSTVARDENTRSAEPAADEELERRRSLQVLRKLGAQLLLDIGDKHPVARRVFELAAEGIEEAEEQGAIIGCTVEEVYAARETLKYHAKRIRDEHDVAEERRMKELREAKEGES